MQLLTHIANYEEKSKMQNIEYTHKLEFLSVIEEEGESCDVYHEGIFRENHQTDFECVKKELSDITENVCESKKGRDKRVSRIPVRQTKLPITAYEDNNSDHFIPSVLRENADVAICKGGTKIECPDARAFSISTYNEARSETDGKSRTTAGEPIEMISVCHTLSCGESIDKAINVPENRTHDSFKSNRLAKTRAIHSVTDGFTKMDRLSDIYNCSCSTEAMTENDPPNDIRNILIHNLSCEALGNHLHNKFSEDDSLLPNGKLLTQFQESSNKLVHPKQDFSFNIGRTYYGNHNIEENEYAFTSIAANEILTDKNSSNIESEGTLAQANIEISLDKTKNIEMITSNRFHIEDQKQNVSFENITSNYPEKNNAKGEFARSSLTAKEIIENSEANIHSNQTIDAKLLSFAEENDNMPCCEDHAVSKAWNHIKAQASDQYDLLCDAELVSSTSTSSSSANKNNVGSLAEENVVIDTKSGADNEQVCSHICLPNSKKKHLDQNDPSADNTDTSQYSIGYDFPFIDVSTTDIGANENPANHSRVGIDGASKEGDEYLIDSSSETTTIKLLNQIGNGDSNTVDSNDEMKPNVDVKYVSSSQNENTFPFIDTTSQENDQEMPPTLKNTILTTHKWDALRERNDSGMSENGTESVINIRNNIKGSGYFNFEGGTDIKLFNDIKDIYRELAKIGSTSENSQMSMHSLSPRAPLARQESEEPILEAPEAFRCTSGDDSKCNTNKQVDIVEPEEESRMELSYRDHDNAYSAETGDTSRRTTDKDNAKRERIDEFFMLCDQYNADTVDKDNDHVESVRVVHNNNNTNVTARHVGLTAPVQVYNDTSKMNVEVSTTVTESSEPSKETASDVETLKLRLADEVEVMLAPLPQTKAIGSCYNAGDGKNIADECAERWDAVNVPGSTYNAGDDGECVCLCAGRSQFSGASIEIDVARCASAPGCSRVSTATVSVARPNSSSCIYPVHTNNSHGDNEIITPKTSCTNNPIESTSYVRNSTVIEENKTNDNSIESPTYLRWGFKNGRLVFDVDVEESENDTTKNQNVINKTGDTNLNTDVNTVLSSKELNKRIDENRSRLRNLENKLKTAGIKDEQIRTNSSSIYQPKEQSQTNSLDSVSKDKIIEQVVPDKETCSNKENINYDANQNIVTVDKTESQEEEEEEEIIPEDVIDLADGDFCQFDVRQVAAFPSGLNGYCDVYDELEETDSDDEDVYAVVLQCRKQTNSNTMGTDSDRPKHNPDTDNLKSLLKRPGRNKDRKSNRVVFNENKNEFFDADYIILIREECDYDDEDEDGVCTCNQHEMVRLTCCEPNCNCSVYDGFEQAPQSPKFAPPLEFVDAVTLSPPEGYKDMELGEQQLLTLQQMAKRGQRAAVCKECSASHEEHDDDGSQSDEGGGDQNSDPEDTNIVEKEKTDQSQQTTPTTPINDTDSTARNFPLENVVMTSEQRMMREAEDERNAASSSPIQPSGGSPISGILKGGKLWKQQSLDGNAPKFIEPQQMTDSSITSDEEGNNRRSVRFIESNSAKRDGCDGAPDNQVEENSKHQDVTITPIKQTDACNNSTSPESTEMMLTFKLGNHVLISNNSLKPNSAVRQLFPCTKPTVGKEDESIHQYLVTAESLRAFEEAKRFKLPQIIQSGETDDSIERAIERNTLRRSLIRYEPRNKKPVQKTDNSLVERIKQLTCDVDDINQAEEIPPRISPPGEEARNSPEITAVLKNHDKSFSPSSSSTTSSNSSSTSSTYKKITDLFAKRDKPQEMQNNLVNNSNETTAKLLPSLPDLGNGPHELEHIHLPLNKLNSTNDSRKQFLSTLAPLTACVSGLGNNDEHYYHMNNHVGDRTSVASSVGTEYSLEDIDEALRNGDEDPKRITPDVLAGTPSASEAGDELAMFVQQDASRIERIKKKYLPEPTKEEDDEHDDYGFNKRPSVRGIKPRFGTTTEIIQQIQNQLQPPMQTVRVAWPYYSESGLSTTVDNSKSRNINQNLIYQYPHVPEEVKARGLAPPYRPTSLQDETLYQNSSNQTCPKQPFNPYANPNYSPVMKVDGRCSEYYQSLPRPKNGRPQSPPPLDMSKTFHQTMVYIPYNHIEGYQPTISPNPYYPPSDYSRVSAQNQINKRYIEPIYQQRIHQHMDEHQYRPNMLPPMPPKQMIRAPFPIVPQPHMINSRSESPLPGQFSTARSTQTPVATLSTCNYYATQPRYRPMVGPVWQGDPAYVNKMNRHSFPMGPRYATSDNGSVTDSDSQHSSGQMPNGYRQSVEITFTPHKDSIASSPTKSRFIERGVPEGAASVSSQDSTNVSQSNSSTMTSPTSPQNPPVQKPLFYAMNV